MKTRRFKESKPQLWTHSASMGQAVEPDLHICVSVCGSVWAGDTLHDFNTDRGTPGFKVHMDQEWESVTLIHATQQKNDYWTFSVKLALL